MKINEESRPFREFFPETNLRNALHYQFAHKFLPAYVHQNPYGFFLHLFGEKKADPTRFIQSRWSMIFEEAVGVVPPPLADSEELMFRRVSDLKMTIHELAGQPVALVEMPSPEAPTDAFFVGIALSVSTVNPVAWSHEVKARVLTLEAELDEPERAMREGMVCEWTDEGTHQNFGKVSRATATEFLEAMRELLQQPGRMPSASYTPPDNRSVMNVGAPGFAGRGKEAKPWWRFW